MKRLFSLLAAVMFCASVMAQAVIKFEKTSLDFGNSANRKYKLVNLFLPTRAINLW